MSDRQRRRIQQLCMCVFLLGIGSGCERSDNYGLAPISGLIKIDGQPVAKINVTFNPTSKDEEGNPGPFSFGVTDENGQYTLMTNKGEPGAVVGPHKVAISGEYYEGDRLVTKEFIPKRYNNPTELTFDVPKGGTDAANFEIESK